MDAPATYGWLLYQDARNRDLLGGLPSFDELFASRAVPGVAESLIARGFGAIPDTNTLDVPVPWRHSGNRHEIKGRIDRWNCPHIPPTLPFTGEQKPGWPDSSPG